MSEYDPMPSSAAPIATNTATGYLRKTASTGSRSRLSSATISLNTGVSSIAKRR